MRGQRCRLLPSPRPSPTGRGRKPGSPLSYREREKTGQSSLLQGEGENRAVPSPTGRGRKPGSPLSYRERDKTGQFPLPYGERARVRGWHYASFGYPAAISLPVNCAIQPSGLSKMRMAVKFGCEPISNQCGVPAGTEIRSFFSHST
jgi:hypothetical protein